MGLLTTERERVTGPVADKTRVLVAAPRLALMSQARRLSFMGFLNWPAHRRRDSIFIRGDCSRCLLNIKFASCGKVHSRVDSMRQNRRFGIRGIVDLFVSAGG